jgi:SAM-dependent methyltransferase
LRANSNNSRRRRRRKEEEADVLLATDEVGSRASAAIDDDNNNNCHDVNLLLSCQLLRQSALRRFRWRRRQMTLVQYGFLDRVLRTRVDGLGMLGWYWYRVVVVGQEEIEWRRHLAAGCDDGDESSILDDNDNESGIRRGACRLAQTALFLGPPTAIRLPLFRGAPSMKIRPAVPPTMHTLVYNMMAPGTTTTATSSGWNWRWWGSRIGGIVENGNDNGSSSALLLHRLVREVIVKQQQGMQHRRQRHSLLDVGCGVGSLYEHVYDVVDAYHGLALTGPEVELARTWHHQHRQDCPASSSSAAATATFQQHDFLVTDDEDDRSTSFRPDSAFSTIVAIDSLVYGAGRNQLRSVLDHLIRNALQPGGLFIIVDDVRYGDDDDDDDATTSKQNDDLWTYQQWQETLEQLGCPMVFARDLSLEYWLDFATPIHICRNSRHRRPPSFGRRWWFHFLDTMLPAENDLDVLLRRDQQRLVRHWQQRQQRHRHAQLMYHLYACRRRPLDDVAAG